MSQENVECVHRLLRAFNDADVEAIVAECDRAVEWEEQSIPGVERVFRGHDGVRRWAALLLGQELGALGGTIEQIEEADDAVIASLLLEGQGSGSGVPVRMRVHVVLTFLAGKVVRRQVFDTVADALEAAGLSAEDAQHDSS